MRILIVLLLFSSTIHAQPCVQEINEQVWKPFVTALVNRDAAAFMAVHSKNMVRVERNSKSILNFDAYKASMEANWPTRKKNTEVELKHTFELRFLERLCNNELAYEVGYYKNAFTDKVGSIQAFYGEFHVTLKKESGQWKIVVDSDTNKNGTINETMFQAANPLE